MLPSPGVVPLGVAGMDEAVVLAVDLLGEARVHAVDDAVVAEAGHGVPVLQGQLQDPLVRPHGVEQAPVVDHLVEVVHVVGVVGHAAALGVAAHAQLGRLFHHLEEAPLQQGPGGRGRHRRGSDRGHVQLDPPSHEGGGILTGSRASGRSNSV